MNDASHEPRPFDCPDCGHHHKADLHGMVGHPEVHGKVPCAKCGKLMWLSLQENGEPLVELFEEHLHAEAHEKRVTDAKVKREAAAVAGAAVQPPVEASVGTGGGSMMGTLFAAAIVAALVSLLLGNLGSKDSGAQTDPRVDELQKQVSAWREDSAAARSEAKAFSGKLAALETAIQQQATDAAARPQDGAGAEQAAAAAIKPVADKQAALAEALAGVKAAYKALDGRIEGNYIKLRQIDKRLKKVETP